MQMRRFRLWCAVSAVLEAACKEPRRNGAKMPAERGSRAVTAPSSAARSERSGMIGAAASRAAGWAKDSPALAVRLRGIGKTFGATNAVDNVDLDLIAGETHGLIAERQLVEIVKGVSSSPRVLILDEPTSSLTGREARELFRIVARLTSMGTAIVYISHKLDEIFAVTHRVTVLRDGAKVATAPTG